MRDLMTPAEPKRRPIGFEYPTEKLSANTLSARGRPEKKRVRKRVKAGNILEKILI